LLFHLIIIILLFKFEHYSSQTGVSDSDMMMSSSTDTTRNSRAIELEQVFYVSKCNANSHSDVELIASPGEKFNIPECFLLLQSGHGPRLAICQPCRDHGNIQNSSFNTHYSSWQSNF